MFVLDEIVVPASSVAIWHHIYICIHTSIHPSIHPSIHTCIHTCRLHACIHTYNTTCPYTTFPHTTCPTPILHHLFSLSCFPHAIFTFLLLLVGRSWHVGLSGPLIFLFKPVYAFSRGFWFMVSASKEQGKDWTGFDQARPGETEGCWQNLRKSWQKMEVFHLSRWQLSQVWRTLGTFLCWGGSCLTSLPTFAISWVWQPVDQVWSICGCSEAVLSFTWLADEINGHVHPLHYQSPGMSGKVNRFLDSGFYVVLVADHKVALVLDDILSGYSAELADFTGVKSFDERSENWTSENAFENGDKTQHDQHDSCLLWFVAGL